MKDIKKIPNIKLRDGEPCSHTGCLNHITHPCEGCGRIGGISVKERSAGQLHSDIMSLKYNFDKSKEVAPIGYKWLSNVKKDDENQLKIYNSQGYSVLLQAYNMYGKLIEDSFGIYRKVD